MTNLNENLLKILWEQCYALSKQIEKYKINSYPSDEIRMHIEELSEINEKFLDVFSQDAQTIVSSQLKLYSDLFKFFQERIVKSVAFANTTNHPSEVMIPVKEIVKTIGGNSKFITEPSWDLNYAIGDYWSPFINFTNKEGITDIEIDKKIVIQFPSLHQDNVLLGSIMGHEIGHYLDLHHGLNITEQILPKLLNHSAIDQLIPFLTSPDIELFDSEAKKEIIRSILSKYFLINWTKEFVADISGILLYGPASHFSCEQIFMFFGVSDSDLLIDAFSNTHPRNYVRSQVRRKTLSHLEYDGILPEKIQTNIDSWDAAWETANNSQINIEYSDVYFNSYLVKFIFNNESCGLIEKILMDNLEYIISKVVSNIPQEIHYKSSNIVEWVNPLAEKLSKLIPPNELDNKPADSISILNAGWFAYYLYGESLKQERGIESIKGEIELREILNNLIRKALTSANTHRRWLNVSNV